MAENHPAVDDILESIPLDSEFGPNKVREYNQIFSALEKHGYTDVIDELKDEIVSDTRSDEHHYLPSAKKVCRKIVGHTGVDTDLEQDLPREF